METLTKAVDQMGWKFGQVRTGDGQERSLVTDLNGLPDLSLSIH